MDELKLTPETKKGEMPSRLTAKQVSQLDGSDFYPAHFYNAVVEIVRSNVALNDFEEGIIKPDEVRMKGKFTLFEKRKPGCKPRMQIRGRELKRIYHEGRQPHRFDGDLDRLTA